MNKMKKGKHSLNEIENSKNTGFYLKLEYNILNEFLKTVADRYDWEIIRTDKDVLIAKIIKRKGMDFISTFER